LIYELLDEICDFGYPQLTEISALKQFLTTEGVKGIARTDVAEKIAIQTTGAVSWRTPGIKYRKNEAFSMCERTNG
jgi:AP-2 complex subunit mu-1